MLKKEDIIVHNKLCEDSIAETYLCSYDCDGKSVLFKLYAYDKKELTERGIFETVLDGIATRTTLHHENLVNVLDVIYDSSHVYVISYHFSGESLREFLNKIPFLRYDILQRIMAQIFNASFYLFEEKISLGVLTPEMVSIDKSSNVRIDLLHFNHGEGLKEIYRSYDLYSAPEVTMGQTFLRTSIFYSIGKILELLNSKVPLENRYGSTRLLVARLTEEDPTERVRVVFDNFKAIRGSLLFRNIDWKELCPARDGENVVKRMEGGVPLPILFP